jgi:hypothetical protein
MEKSAKNTNRLAISGLVTLSADEKAQVNGGYDWLAWSERVSAMGWGNYWRNVWHAATSW